MFSEIKIIIIREKTIVSRYAVPVVSPHKKYLYSYLTLEKKKRPCYNLAYPVQQHTFVSPSAFSRRAVVSYWRKYVHEVLVNRLGGLSLPRKSVVRLTDRPDMTLDVYCGRKTSTTIWLRIRSVITCSVDCVKR